MLELDDRAPSAAGLRTVTIIVASLLGGSLGLSYCVLILQPELYNSTRAFSHASAMHSPSAISTGIPAIRMPFHATVSNAVLLLTVKALFTRGGLPIE